MKPRSVLYIVLLVLLAIFVIANWSLIASSAQINFLVGRINAPLGFLIAIIVAAVLAVDYIAHMLARMRDRRTFEQDLEHWRVRAEEAEQSRVTELRGIVEREFADVHAKLDRAIAQPAPSSSRPTALSDSRGPAA